MIYYGMTPNPALSAKMVMTERELKRMKHSKLRPQCYENGGKYYCFHGAGGNQVGLGTYDTIYECNETWDKYDLAKDKPVLKQNRILRKPNGRGYCLEKLRSGNTVLRAQIQYKQRTYVLARTQCEEKARAAYLEAIDHINNGTFLEWHKTLNCASQKKHKENYKAA